MNDVYDQGNSFRGVPDVVPKSQVDITCDITPTADITTFQLAQIVAHLIPKPVWFTKTDWDALPAGLKRHFTAR